MTRVAIRAEGICKSFRLPHERRTTLKERFLHPLRRDDATELLALRGVGFSVERGEFFGVIGPNGSGKSTLLKIIAGIYVADSGVVRIEGRLSPFIELGVGFNEELSARDNVRVNGVLLGLSLSQIDERYDDIVAYAGLERFMDQRLKNFSSGMKIRLAYAVAIQVDFDVLLLDEVLAVGDHEFQEKCLDTLEQIRASGKTVVFVSHDLEAVRRHCDRVLYLEHGEVAGLGAPEAIVDQYTAVAHSIATS